MKTGGLSLVVGVFFVLCQVSILSQSVVAQIEEENAFGQIELNEELAGGDQAEEGGVYDNSSDSSGLGQYEQQELDEVLQYENVPVLENEYDASGGMAEEGGGADAYIDASGSIQYEEQEPYEILQYENVPGLESEYGGSGGMVEEGGGIDGDQEASEAEQYEQESYGTLQDETAPVENMYDAGGEASGSESAQYEQESGEVYLEENATGIQNEGRAE